MVALVCLAALGTALHADNDRPVTISQLPAPAQLIVRKHFGKLKVAMAKMESGLLGTNYDVVFTNGTKVEFDRHGDWTEVKCKDAAVPAALVPAAISLYVKNHYPNTHIVKVEKDKRKYEVDLSNGVEVTFNTRFQVTDIDM